MELFDEVKNRYFQLVGRLINEAIDGRRAAELVELIEAEEFEQKILDKEQRPFTELVLNQARQASENFNLLQEREGKFYPILTTGARLPVPIRLTKIEQAWLKALIAEPKLKLFLNPTLYAKLEVAFAMSETPFQSEYLEVTNLTELPEILDFEGYQQNIQLILEALLEEKAIRYSNRDRRGNLYQDQLALPINLEYSLLDERFRVSLYSLDEQRPVMANLWTMFAVKVVEQVPELDRETAQKLMVQQKYAAAPIVLEVFDQKGAMERCFMCFSGLERTARILGEARYELQLNYYLFEEENILRKLLSLGPYVKVLAPQRIRAAMITQIKAALELQHE